MTTITDIEIPNGARSSASPVSRSIAIAFKGRWIILVISLIWALPMLLAPVLPLVDVGGHRELIEDGVSGLLFPPDDPQAIAAALAGFVDAKELWPAMREAGQSETDIAAFVAHKTPQQCIKHIPTPPGCRTNQSAVRPEWLRQ